MHIDLYCPRVCVQGRIGAWPAQRARSLRGDERAGGSTAVFYSAENLRGVTFTLELPSGVELVGYEEQRKIFWQGALNQGNNLLVLPVIVRNRDGGSLIARVRHGKRIKKFGLFLNVQQPGFPSTSLDRFEGRLLTTI